MFVDIAQIFVKSGSGGNGLVSFRREKYVPAGGPDGGDGGRGGSVILRVDTSLTTLMDFRYKRSYCARNGEDGKPRNSKGADGEDLFIHVPRGTVVRDADSGKIIVDMSEENGEYIIAKGGGGGWGNTHFATPTRQAPKFAKNGIDGEEKNITLELKLIADVALAGFPNVGKSTLLARVSAARPKIADYHFTTLSPNLGVVKIDEGKSFVLADIPGLIEGASDGVGLGHDFLRHIERTRLIIHVVDVTGHEGRDPIEDFEKINEELRLYSPALAEREMIAAANKIDSAAKESRERFAKYISAKGLKLFEISAVTGEGVRELMLYAHSRIEQLPPLTVFESEIIEQPREEEVPFEIRRDNEFYVVEGPLIMRLLRGVNFEDVDSLNYFQRALRRFGIISALVEKGAREGDSVRMYDAEFDFIQ
ncbi:MAG: GTPase ObgE [Clostridia bacterium]|nr:GTPase ObgE [Clostridia bacterium]